jgi:energy-coupling factor transporter ATP-binding protein EcfA2
MATLRNIESFGEIAAEDDPVLDYFLTTDAVQNIESGKTLLVLGRKGSGKTALVRHFTETNPATHGQPLSLRSYPWTTHAALVDKGASETEAYVASWRLLIAIRLASMVSELGSSKYTDTLEGLRKFLMENFGTTRPETKSILSRPKLKVVGLTIGPQVAGISVGSITFGDPTRSLVRGLELDSLANSILTDVSTAVAELSIENLYLHFDELDQGLDVLDDVKKRMLIGLILAARDIKRSTDIRANISPIVYLRTDIWEQVSFSDKNKITRGSTVRLAWNEATLTALVESRLSSKLDASVKWSEIEDGGKMRGSQGKLQHMLSRTLLRPRDVIQFLNEALKIARVRTVDPLVFINDDFNTCREEYSEYLKDELSDEIGPHWSDWTDGLRACSKTQTITFQKDEFLKNYRQIRSPNNPLDGDAALEQLYRFSIVGYLRPSGGGGSSWSFRYSDENAGWDATASRLKVHIGLKEHAQLKEERIGKD